MVSQITSQCSYIGAIDQGTTGTKFIIFDQDLRVISHAYKEHKQICLKPGWVEHDPIEIWVNTRHVISEALKKSALKPGDIDAIGIANQRETTLLWDKRTGKPVSNAIVWQCTRSQPLCDELISKGYEKLIRNKTGLQISTYFSGTKIKWLFENVPNLRERAERNEIAFGTVDSWLIWNLTGEKNLQDAKHLTDHTNASRTLLFNINKLRWDDELLKIFEIPREVLPETKPSMGKKPFGYTSSKGIFGRRIPIAGVLGDHQASLLGQACIDPGDVKNTYGTGSFLVLNTGEHPYMSRNGLITSLAYTFENKCCYLLEGPISVAGASIQWLKDNMGMLDNVAQSEKFGRKVKDSGGVYFVPAFSGLLAPHWNTGARGAIYGLTRFTKKEHLIRAALESICYQTRDVLEAMQSDFGEKPGALKIGGGASQNNLLAQLQADILGIPCIRPLCMETTSMGVAYAAGVVQGLWKSLEDIRSKWKIDRVFKPKWDKERREKAYAEWKRAINRTLNWEE
jgi:glycerol kinase